jgi:HPt (histidine-containing phosphotransfer) domain-containing protein
VRIRKSAPAAIATLAHTLKGSAVGIGADRVAQAAAAAELAASVRQPSAMVRSIGLRRRWTR